MLGNRLAAAGGLVTQTCAAMVVVVGASGVRHRKRDGHEHGRQLRLVLRPVLRQVQAHADFHSGGGEEDGEGWRLVLEVPLVGPP